MSKRTKHITGGHVPRTDRMSILDNGIMSSAAHLRTLLSDNALSDVEKRNILIWGRPTLTPPCQHRIKG